MANRIIASETAANGEKVDVTPEAINRFHFGVTEIQPWAGSAVDGKSLPVKYLSSQIHANVGEPAPVTLTVSVMDDEMAKTEEFDELEFANALLNTIVRNNGDIDNVSLLQNSVKSLKKEIVSEMWKKDGSIYVGAVIDGFGYIETKGEPIFAVGCIRCEEGGLAAADCVAISNVTGQTKEKSRLHFLPEGENKFLVFDVIITALGPIDGSFFLNTSSWPAPSLEVPVGEIPKKRSEYANEKEYLDAVDKYLERHMCAGNDKRVELEDDLVF